MILACYLMTAVAVALAAALVLLQVLLRSYERQAQQYYRELTDLRATLEQCRLRETKLRQALREGLEGSPEKPCEPKAPTPGA